MSRCHDRQNPTLEHSRAIPNSVRAVSLPPEPCTATRCPVHLCAPNGLCLSIFAKIRPSLPTTSRLPHVLLRATSSPTTTGVTNLKFLLGLVSASLLSAGLLAAVPAA